MAVDNKKSATYTIEADQTLRQIIQTFYYFGVWQSDEGCRICSAVKRLSFSVLSVFLPIFLTANAFLCGDKNESIYSVQLAVVTAVIFVKCMYIVFKQQEILGFLYDPTVTHSIEDRQEYERVNKVLMKLEKYFRRYFAAIACTGALNIIIQLPLLSSDKVLPTFINFSWQDSEIIYWLAFVSVTLALVCLLIVFLLNFIIWYIMLNYSYEYKLLGNKLKKLGWGTTGIKSRNPKVIQFMQEQLFIDNIVSLIKEHHNLTETIERFRSCFSKLFFSQIATSGINICISIFNLAYASDENVAQTQLFILILFYGIFDIFCVMYLANEITMENDRLSYCLFESNWYEHTEKAKKYVIIMGEALKQPQLLVIFIYPMNLETFTTIINGGYSMFNILKNFK